MSTVRFDSPHYEVAHEELLANLACAAGGTGPIRERDWYKQHVEPLPRDSEFPARLREAFDGICHGLSVSDSFELVKRCHEVGVNFDMSLRALSVEGFGG